MGAKLERRRLWTAVLRASPSPAYDVSQSLLPKSNATRQQASESTATEEGASTPGATAAVYWA
jgi:hypothetical protein